MTCEPYCSGVCGQDRANEETLLYHRGNLVPSEMQRNIAARRWIYGKNRYSWSILWLFNSVERHKRTKVLHGWKFGFTKFGFTNNINS